MTEREDYDRLADELDRVTESLERRSGELHEEIGEVRQDWERKRTDEKVPGASPPREATDRDAPGDEVNPADAGRSEHEDPDTPADPDVAADPDAAG